MSLAEIKKEIIEKVDALSPAQLKEVNKFIDQINNLSSKEWDLLPHIENTVSEREEVLQKLAK